VLGVSLQTLRKGILKNYPTPALGLTALGLQDLRLSPLSKDDMLALDLNDELEFAFNSHEVPKEARPILDGIARLLVENPDTVIQVVCHTDDQGDDGYNLRLSERRAEALKAYLVGRGVAEQRLTAIGRGEEDPAVETGTRTPTRAERAKNRRTELLIAPLGPVAGKDSAPPPDPGATSSASDETRPPADGPVLKGAASGQ
jgi:outer membrane protein OmpA-like peptidoglycan-associated protein